MDMPVSIVLSEGNNCIELHYWLENNLHKMDAFVQNTCERNFLSIVREFSEILDVKVSVKTEPLADGGIKRIYTFLSKEKVKESVLISIIVSLLTLPFEPVKTIFNHYLNNWLNKESIEQQEEISQLEREKLLLEIENLKKRNLDDEKITKKEEVIKRRKSEFYDTLRSESKVKQVSFIVKNDNGENLSDERFVSRAIFDDFIFEAVPLEPIIDEKATIQVISPVLRRENKFKWRGLYKGHIYAFNMQAKDFIEQVDHGDVVFGNGSAIVCRLEIKRRYDKNGKENRTYNIVEVFGTFHEVHHDYQEIKKKKQPKTSLSSDKDTGQLTLFNLEDDENNSTD